MGALAVFRIDGGVDFDFLERVFNKLSVNFTRWVNREDARGDNIFEGGFPGLDNIGPFDRLVMLPGEVLEQSDGTAWMAKFFSRCLRWRCCSPIAIRSTRISRSNSSSTSR
jgi:hypothetical protein